MDIEFNFDGSNFMAGFVGAYIWFSDVSLWWLILSASFLFSVKIIGWPYLTVGYERARGFYVDKGRCT